MPSSAVTDTSSEAVARRNAEFVAHWPRYSGIVKRYLKNLAKHPTERNLCFMQGYIAALHEHKLIDDGTHAYSSALINCVTTHRDIMTLIMEAS